MKFLPAKTITGWVIRQNKSVLLKENDLKMLEEAGEVELIGTQCKVWMGVPSEGRRQYYWSNVSSGL